MSCSGRICRPEKGIEPARVERAEDWADAPDVLGFVGRAEELATLREWVVREHCRVVAILGIGGIGKTALTAELAQDIAPGFQRLYWRSLRNALPFSDWTAAAIRFLSDQQMVPPEDDAARLAVLVQLLREQRILLVLDNFETLLRPNDPDGSYRDGYSGYGSLLQTVAEVRHQSCLLVTSREMPQSSRQGFWVEPYVVCGLADWAFPKVNSCWRISSYRAA